MSLPISALPALMPHLEDFLRDWTDQQRRSARVPGIQVAVRLGEKLLFSYASGIASTATGEPLTTAHAFRIASHSKTFAATGIMQLVEQGRLRLDDTLATWVPELADSPIADVTVREALGHQSGALRDGRDASFWQLLREFPDREGVLAELIEGERVYGSNTHFHYSNLVYSVLGMVIESVTGQSFTDAMIDMLEPLRERMGSDFVLGPELGIGGTPAYADGHAIPEAERGEGSGVAPVIAPVDTRAQSAATGFWGNAETVSAWIAAHAFGTGLFLTDDTKRLIQRSESTITANGSTRSYGLGFIVHEQGDVRYIGHSGGFPGHITQTMGDPKTGLTVSVLTNRIDGPASALSTGIHALLQKVLGVLENADAPRALPEIAGRYLSLWQSEWFLSLPGLVLRTADTSTDPSVGVMVLRVEEDGRLRADAADGFADAGEIATLERDESGRVRSVTTTGITGWRPDVYASLGVQPQG